MLKSTIFNTLSRGGGALEASSPASEICFYKSKYVAFTLAEVLITLGIIGIVVAMTLPAFIQKYQKKLAAQELKVAYTKLYQAIQLAEAEHGEAQYWQYFDENLSRAENSWNFTNTYLAPYFKKLNIYNNVKLKSCKNITYKYLDGTIPPCNGLAAFCETCSSNQNMTQLHLQDGTSIIPFLRATGTEENYYTQQIELHIDTNGYKGPNQWGKDIFRFHLGKMTNYKLYGAGSYTYRAAGLRHCLETNGGFSCGSIIMYDDWEIKDDYPW